MSGLVGFGLDYTYWDQYPGTLDGLCNNFRARLSHLSVVSIKNLQQAGVFCRLAGDLPRIHHLSNIAPCNPSGCDWTRLRLQDDISQALSARWCGEDIGIWSLGPYDIPYFIPPLFEMDIADLVGRRIVQLQDRISIPFLAEIPSCTLAIGRLTLGEFFTRLVDTSGCHIVLDVGHVYSYAIARNRSASDVLRSLPLYAVWEAHIAGAQLDHNGPARYVDTHNDPILPEVLELLGAALELCPELRCITFELGDSLRQGQIESDLSRVEELARASGFSPSI